MFDIRVRNTYTDAVAYIESLNIVNQQWIINNNDIVHNSISSLYVGMYQQYYDEVVNYGLRNRKLSRTGYDLCMLLINTIDNAMLIDDIVLYRGTKNIDYSNIKVGDVLNNLGFQSKSVSETVAYDFSDQQYVLAIHYTNSKHIWLNRIHRFYSELEFLTYPGEILEVISIDDTDIDNLSIIWLKPISNLYDSYDILESMIDESIDIKFNEIVNNIRNNLFDDRVVVVITNNNKYYVYFDLYEPNIVYITSNNEKIMTSDIEEIDGLYRDYVIGTLSNIIITNQQLLNNNEPITVLISSAIGVIY